MASSEAGFRATTNDGCPVEVYASLSPRREAASIGRLLEPGASILDLGAGTGLLAEPLAARGFRVVAVDDSPEMLSRLQRSEPVYAQIEGLRLDEQFDVVLLASHLVNTPDSAKRQRLLETAARHVKSSGRVAVEWHPPKWFDGLVPSQRQQGSVDGFTVTLHVDDLTDGLLTATVVYQGDATSWSQEFQTRRLTQRDLVQVLRQVHLLIDGNLEDDDNWVIARPLA